jgi:hypothetical protein
MNRLVGMVGAPLTEWTLTDMNNVNILHNDQGRSFDPETS